MLKFVPVARLQSPWTGKAWGDLLPPLCAPDTLTAGIYWDLSHGGFPTGDSTGLSVLSVPGTVQVWMWQSGQVCV